MAEAKAISGTEGSQSGHGGGAAGSRCLRACVGVAVGLAASAGSLPAAVAQQAIPAAPVYAFNSAAVGISPASTQTQTLSFTVSGYSGSFTPTAQLHYGLSYTMGAITCSGGFPSQTCTVPVTFLPQYPGGRKDALFLMNGATRLATVLLYGVGEGPLALVQPASSMNIYYSTGTGSSNQYFYQSVTDENGTVWSLGNSGALVSYTKSGVFFVPIASGVDSYTLAIDGAGVIYIGSVNPATSFTTYDTVQGTQGTYPLPVTSSSPVIPHTGAAETVGVGNTGNVYAAGASAGPSGFGWLYTIPPSGASTETALANSSPGQSGSDDPLAIAVDSAENLFFGGDWTINEYSNTFTQSLLNTNQSKSGIAVDAAGTLYSARYGSSASIYELAASNYATPFYVVPEDDSNGAWGVSLGPDGTINEGAFYDLVQFVRSSGAISFATTYGGAVPAAQDAGIYNGGNQPLTISDIVQSGSAAFTVQSVGANNCNVGMVLAPGAGCEVAIGFISPHPGSFTGALTFTTNSLNAANSSQVVALSATTTGVYVAASPSTLNFGNQATGTSATQTVTLTNDSIGAAVDIYASSVSNSAFKVTLAAACTDIVSGGSCQAGVTFSPTAVTSYNGTTGTLSVTMVGSGNGPAVALTLNGAGVAPAPAATFNPTSVAFGSQAVGSISAPAVVQLTNSGTASMAISGIAITGTNPSAFVLGTSATSPCGTTLAVGASCNISVTFNPNAFGALSANISVADSAAATPQTVPLTGTGVLVINEVLHLSDAPAVVAPTPLAINEVLHVSDAPTVVPPTPLSINEVLHVADTPATQLSFATATVLRTSATQIPFGSTIQLSTQTTASGTSAAPGGMVNYYDGAALIGSSTIGGSGASTLSIGTLSVGVHNLQAQYPGGSGFAASNSQIVTVTVTVDYLTVTAGNASRNFETANPAFSYTISGFVNGDTISVVSGAPVLSTTATLNSPAGNYPIGASAGTLSAPANYGFAFVNGTLAVSGNVPQTITFLSIPNLSFSVVSTITMTAHSTSGLPVNYSVTGPATVSGSRVTLTGTGTVSVTASQSGNATFAPAVSVTRSFTVAP